MNWEALGAIGEIVGAAGVIVSLLYLATQIRQNTKSVRAASRDETFKSFSQYREHILREPELAALYLHGLQNPLDLDPPDRLRFRLLLSELFFTYQSVYLRAMGISDPQPWLWVSRSLHQFLRQPAVQDWWNSAKWEYVAEFAAEVDKHLQATCEPDDLKQEESVWEDSDVA